MSGDNKPSNQGQVSFLQSKFMNDALLVGDNTSLGISSNALASS